MNAIDRAASNTAAGRARSRRALVQLVRPARNRLIVIVVLVMAGAACELLPPLLIRSVVDDHLAIGERSGLLNLAFLYLAAVVFAQGLSFAYGYLSAGVAQDILCRLRIKLFEHLQRLPTSYFDRTPIGDSISRCTADVDTLDTLFTGGIANLVANLSRLLTITIAMITLSPRLSLVSAITLPPLLLVTRYFQVRIRAAERVSRRAVAEMNGQLHETLQGVEVIQAYRRELSFVQRFRRILQGALRVSNRSTVYGSVYSPVTALLTSCAIALLLWAGTRHLPATVSPSEVRGVISTVGSSLGFIGFSTGVSIGTLIAFALLLQRFFGPLTALGDEWQSVQGALSGAERIFEVLALPIDKPPSSQPFQSPRDDPAGGIFCEGVVFGYASGATVLHGVDLRVAPGEHVALVGRTGAGKSSIVNLLAGLYNPWQGCVRVAGYDPRNLGDDHKNRVIGIVPQSSQLFSGTVLQNLTFNDDNILPSTVISAAAISGADAFIRDLPDGYQTLLRSAGGGSGVQFSAGQQQLLSLTRALVSCPAVLLFDEATSFIDSASETALRDALRATVLKSGTAVLSIAHRLATARHADRVVVIDHGVIVEVGTPAELIARGGPFATMLELEAAGWDWQA